MSNADLSRVTAIVYAHDARGMSRLVASFRRSYPSVTLLAADDQNVLGDLPGADVVKLTRRGGAGAARNALLARVRTPYFLLLESSFEFVRRTAVEALLAPVAAGRFDLIAGELIACRKKWLVLTERRPDAGSGTLSIADAALTVVTGARPAVDGVSTCDLAHNFFVARTDKARQIGGWDQSLSAGERLEFFARAQRFGLRVGVRPEVVAQRWSDGADDGADFAGAACRLGVAKIIDAAGRVHAAPAPAAAA